jgi:hypothetical protein
MATKRRIGEEVVDTFQSGVNRFSDTGYSNQQLSFAELEDQKYRSLTTEPP